MKKALLVVLLTSFGLAACKKDYTCVCTHIITPYYPSSSSQSSTTTSARTIEHTTKKDAQSRCQGGNFQSTAGNGVQNTTCNLD